MHRDQSSRRLAVEFLALRYLVVAVWLTAMVGFGMLLSAISPPSRGDEAAPQEGVRAASNLSGDFQLLVRAGLAANKSYPEQPAQPHLNATYALVKPQETNAFSWQSLVTDIEAAQAGALPPTGSESVRQTEVEATGPELEKDGGAAETLAPEVLDSVLSSEILGLGDSVLLGAAAQLTDAFPNLTIEAAVGRQVSEAIAALQRRAATTGIPQTVIIHIGNNGTFSSSEFDQIMSILGPERRVLFVNLRVPRPWQDANNANIAAGVSRYTNTTLVNWQGASATRPDLFAPDGVHIAASGGILLTSLIAADLSS